MTKKVKVCDARWVSFSKSGKKYTIYCTAEAGHRTVCRYFKSCHVYDVPKRFKLAGKRGDGK